MTTTALHTPAGLGQHLHRARFAPVNEDELQSGIAAELAALGVVFAREVRLSAADRPDFMVTLPGVRLALEVKVKGAAGQVRRQLARYAAREAVDELMLVTTMRRHLHGMPERIGGKTLHLVLVGTAG